MNVIGFYRVEHTALSLSMRLMDEFPNIKLTRKKNFDCNPGFPSNEYPFMLILESGASIEECKKIHSSHFARFKYDKNYRMKYDLSNLYYKGY